MKCDQSKMRRSIFLELSTLLEIHMTIEESIFYPAYRELMGTQEGIDQAREAQEEHHVVDLLLAELARADPSDEGFEAKVRVFQDIVDRHIENEERGMFLDAERRTDRAGLKMLGVQLEDLANHLSH
jgi:hypothetical protein